jgi:Zn-dependent protease
MTDDNHWSLGRWGRIPVSMHWTVLLAFAWMYLIFWSFTGMLVASVAFFIVLVVHEFGHVFTLRRLKVPIDRIVLFGIHGDVSHGYAGPGGEIAVAWSGVAAQLVLLLLALAVATFVDFSAAPMLGAILGPAWFVFVKLNLFVMVIALLPIGPFDGRVAWSVFKYWKAKAKKRRREKQELLLNPERALSPEKRRELEESSSRAAEELLGKFSKPSGKKEEES